MEKNSSQLMLLAIQSDDLKSLTELNDNSAASAQAYVMISMSPEYFPVQTANEDSLNKMLVEDLCQEFAGILRIHRDDPYAGIYN